MNFDINFDFNFWSILFATLGYAFGAFTKGVGKSNQQDQLIRDLAQLQATNRDLEIQNDKLNRTLFESTKENQRLLKQSEMVRYKPYDDTDVYEGKKVTYLDPPFISTCEVSNEQP